MVKDRPIQAEQAVRYLKDHGKFWEIFGFSDNGFTALELAKHYSILMKTSGDNPEDITIINDTFAILNAPFTRQLYENCRKAMQNIRMDFPNDYLRIEDKIWSDLWRWVSERGQEPSAQIINAIKIKYKQIKDQTVNTTSQGQIWTGNELKPAELDSVTAVEAFSREIKCQSCGKFDHTLRVVAFPYVISILISSFRRVGESGVFCYRCRCIKSLKWALVSLLFGWWSIWGFFWNIAALIDNFRGGKMPVENNEPLVKKLVWANLVLGRIAEAKAALKELFKYSPSEDTLRLQRYLDEKYSTISPARFATFRLGYLTVAFAVVGIYVVAGMAIFGGAFASHATSSQVSPGSISPIRTTPVFYNTPTPQVTSGFTSPIGTTPAFYNTPTPSLKSNKSDLLTQINTNKAQLRLYESQIEAIDTELDGYQAKIDAIESRYPSLRIPEPYYSQYRDLVQQYNLRVDKRNSLYNDYKSLLQSTNNLIDQYNLTR